MRSVFGPSLQQIKIKEQRKVLNYFQYKISLLSHRSWCHLNIMKWRSGEGTVKDTRRWGSEDVSWAVNKLLVNRRSQSEGLYLTSEKHHPSESIKKLFVELKQPVLNEWRERGEHDVNESQTLGEDKTLQRKNKWFHYVFMEDRWRSSERQEKTMTTQLFDQ